MATIVKIKGSDGEVQYPITKPEAVIDENGKNILEIIQENGGEGCECATPDWSALEGELGHILNRPCYYELSEMNIFETDVMAGSPYLTTMYGGDLFRFKVLGEIFDIDLSGKEIPTYDYNTDIQHKLSYTFDIDTIRVSVDFYDAGDGVLTMEFGYVALEGKDAPEELTLYVAEYVVNGRQRLSEGLIPQTIARKSELTELSAEVGNKQDTISDLADIRSGAAKGATALQSVPDTYATKQYVDNAIKEIPQGGGEPSQYIKDATTSADGNTLTLTKKDGSIVSFSPSGGGGGSTPSEKTEWKCVFDGRFSAGEKNWVFETFADGTPLKANELVVQGICDKAGSNVTAYLQVQSSTNKTLSAFGPFGIEATSGSPDAPFVNQIKMAASPFYMVAEVVGGASATAASMKAVQANGGSTKSLQIYEDIVYIRVYTTAPTTENGGLIKIYAR